PDCTAPGLQAAVDGSWQGAAQKIRQAGQPARTKPQFGKSGLRQGRIRMKSSARTAGTGTMPVRAGCDAPGAGPGAGSACGPKQPVQTDGGRADECKPPASDPIPSWRISSGCCLARHCACHPSGWWLHDSESKPAKAVLKEKVEF